MRPLRLYLLVLVLGAMLPGTLLTAALVWRAYVNSRASAERRLLDSARVDAAALDREFAGTLRLLEALATSPSLDRGDYESFHAEGRRIQATQPGWYTITLLSPSGQPLVNTRLAWGTPLMPLPEVESFRRVIDTRRPAVGTIGTPPRGGREQVFAIRVPVLRDGGTKFVLSAVLDVNALSNVVPRPLPSSDEWTRTILDSSGTIAVRTRGSENYVGSPASRAFLDRLGRAPESITQERTREGVAVYAATSRSRYGWTAVIVVPTGVLDAPLWASMTAILVGGALLVICGFTAVYVVSRRLTADLAAAATAAQAVAEGRPLPGVAGHVAETGQLLWSLATASSLLEKRGRERDEEVRRTEAARAEAEQANQTKDQFLAVLGHELRNPLSPALTALELMRARDATVFTRERQILERQVAHMTRLVNDLLDVSRLARGKAGLERRRFELREAADRALDMVQPLIAQKQHAVHLSIPPAGLVIDGDRDRIVQVLANLLTNAAKYTPAQGRILLAAAAVDGHVRVECEDNGPGVSPELMPTLFEPFAQGPRTPDRREGGLGLGLSLARSLAELHGGTLALEPVKGAGSRFVVTLPRAGAAPDPAIADGHHATRRGPSRRILVVDDNSDAAELLAEALRDAGNVVATAGDGADAVAVASAFRPEVGILDIGLPDVTGYELAVRLREIAPAIRLIAVTGFGKVPDVEAAKNTVFEARCVKPVAIAELVEIVDAGPELTGRERAGMAADGAEPLARHVGTGADPGRA